MSTSVAQPTAPFQSKRSLVRQRPATDRPAKIPAILLEGDPSPPVVDPILPSVETEPASSPGTSAALATVHPFDRPQDLPSLAPAEPSHPAPELFFIAREPEWFYAAWDWSEEAQRQANRRSVEGQLRLRVQALSSPTAPRIEICLHPESRSWFVHWPHPATPLIADLGYATPETGWHSLARSAPAEPLLRAPALPDAPNPAPHVPPAAATVRVESETEVPAPSIPADLLPRVTPPSEAPPTAIANPSPPPLTPSGAATPLPQEEAVPAAPLNNLPSPATTPSRTEPSVGAVATGSSLELIALLRRAGVSGPPVSVPSSAAVVAGGSLSEGQALGPSAPQGFWFRVNAELVIYGATERTAKVRLGGCPITLEPDGTFSARFALPDGEFELPVTAVSADGQFFRGAELQIRRATRYPSEEGQGTDHSMRTPPALAPAPPVSPALT